MGYGKEAASAPLIVDEVDSVVIDSRRHRPALEIRLPDRADSPAHVESSLGAHALTDELRSALWNEIRTFAFDPRSVDASTSTVTERPEVHRIWSSPPISAASPVPADVAELLGRWFSLVEPTDVFELVASVHDQLDAASQPRFARACNAVLERERSARRFVERRLVPIPSRVDITTIERALAACRNAGVVASEERFLGALDRLAVKPEPDGRGAVREAVRAVECMAFALTGEAGEAPRSFDAMLDSLEAKGHLDAMLKSAYSDLSAYLGDVRPTTTSDAGLIIVMCAGLLSHLAGRFE